MLDIRDIMKILPHRYPMLLVDRILELEEGKRAVGIKNVTINEFFFAGHFPQFPIMPGVMIVEAMAQVGGIILLGLPQCEGKFAVFGGIDGMRFRKPVLPGDQLRMEVTVLKMRGAIGKMQAKATVDGATVAEGEILFSLSDWEPSGRSIHPTANVHRKATLGAGVKIGPNVQIGPEVTIGDHAIIDSNAVITNRTSIGNHCHIHVGAILGHIPQDLKYQGEKTSLILGSGNSIREYATLHTASGEGEVTLVGNDNFIMGNAHIAHNCSIGNQVIIGNFSGVTGHVTIEDKAIIGGLTGIHQFVKIGRLAMIGGLSKVVQDVTPYTLTEGNPARVRGVNLIGLKRSAFSQDTIAEIKKAIKLLYFSGKNKTQAVKEMKQALTQSPEIEHLIQFVERSKRGITKKGKEVEA